MIPHPRNYAEPMDSAEVDRILETAYRILEEIGLQIDSPEVLKRLSEAGANVDSNARRLRMTQDFAQKRLALAPARWTLHARNPARNLEIGGKKLFLCPGYGSPFMANARGERRQATMADFTRLAQLAAGAEAVDITGGLLVEPCDVPPALRPLRLTEALITQSDKPCFGSVAGAEGASVSLEIARIVFGNIEHAPSMLGLININSPLRLDKSMAEALLVYAEAGQPVLLTPGILLGITAPVTMAGALAQAFAELIVCTVAAQVLAREFR